MKKKLKSSTNQHLIIIRIESDEIPDLEGIISFYAHSSTELKKIASLLIISIHNSCVNFCKF